MKYGLGCVQSVLDGTEHKVAIDSFEMPEEYSYQDIMPPVLDQGYTSKCVCYTLTSLLDWKVNRLKGTKDSNKFSIDELYNSRADKRADGMQIKEALKYLRHNGLNGTKIEEYAMVGSVEMIKRALILNGPCAIGVPVYQTSDTDFWNGSELLGGHCVMIVGYDKEGLVIRNSWGTSWGSRGYAVIPYDDFKKVFEAWSII